MKATRILVPTVLLAGAIALVLAVGPSLVGKFAYAAAKAANTAEREELVKLSGQEQLSKLFRLVAKTVKPAVVEVRVKKRVQVPELGLPDDFLRRFFGEESPFETPGPALPRTRQPRPRSFMQRGLGSGVIIDAEKGFVLTNYHVVGEADEVEVVLADGRALTAEWVRGDRASDLAVVKVKNDHLISAPLGDSDQVDVGDWVLAIGSPEGLPQTVTAGIISAKGRSTGGRRYEDFLQTDAAINHGNSGGPLVNTQGEVIGINTAIVSQTGVNEGIGLAISSNLAKNVMRQLIDQGKVTRGYLGVGIQDIDDKLAKSFGLPDNKGALVTGLLEDSPAREAGIKEEDFIVAIGGEAVRNVNELRNRVADLKPGDKVEVSFYRGGKKMTVPVKITVQPAEIASAAGGAEEGAKGTRLGIEVRALTPELAKRFGYKESTKGVIVTDVEQGSDAADEGIQPGVVIDRVGEEKIATSEEFHKAISKAKEGGPVRLRVLHPSGMAQYVVITTGKGK